MALEAGALDVLAKAGAQPESLGRWKKRLAEVVEGARLLSMESLLRRSAERAAGTADAARHRPRRGGSRGSPARPRRRRGSSWPPRPAGPPRSGSSSSASPPQHAVVGVAQHMPPPFTRSLAQRLSSGTAWDVREAVSGAEASPGVVWIAPGGGHLEFVRAGRATPPERRAPRALGPLVPLGRPPLRLGGVRVRAAPRRRRPDGDGGRRRRGEPCDRRRGRDRPLRVAGDGRDLRDARRRGARRPRRTAAPARAAARGDRADASRKRRAPTS